MNQSFYYIIIPIEIFLQNIQVSKATTTKGQILHTKRHSTTSETRKPKSQKRARTKAHKNTKRITHIHIHEVERSKKSREQRRSFGIFAPIPRESLHLVQSDKPSRAVRIFLSLRRFVCQTKRYFRLGTNSYI